MKILLATYSAEGHGSYGIVTKELWTRLKNMNPTWTIMQHGWFHESMEPGKWAIEPTMKLVGPDGKARENVQDVYGQLSFPKIVERFKPDVVWTLSDPMQSAYMGKLRTKYNFKLIKHLPVDGIPQPDHWKEVFTDCDLMVPITKFGSEAVTRFFDGKVLPHIYHGVDTDLFKPMSPDIVKSVRPDFGPGAVILGFVGHSQFRKMNFVMYPMLKYIVSGAWARCVACEKISIANWDKNNKVMGPIPGKCSHCGHDAIPGTPINAHLWIHMFDRRASAWVPEKMANVWGVTDRIQFSKDMTADHGIKTKFMPMVYNCFDVYLAMSGGEGFCLPVVEAMACGKPIVYSDYSGHAEVAAGSGLPVKAAAFIPDVGEPIDRIIVDLPDSIDKVVRVIENRNGETNRMREHALRTAREKFSWDIVAHQWSRIINENFSSRATDQLGVVI